MPLGDKIFLESGSMPELIKSGKMLWHRKKRGLKRFLLSTVLLWHILLVDPFKYLSSPRKSKHPSSQLAAAPSPDSTARTSKAERENMAPGQEAPAPPSTPSPGNEYSPDVPPSACHTSSSSTASSWPWTRTPAPSPPSPTPRASTPRAWSSPSPAARCAAPWSGARLSRTVAPTGPSASPTRPKYVFLSFLPFPCSHRNSFLPVLDTFLTLSRLARHWRASSSQ